MSDAELDEYGRKVRESLSKPGSAKAGERIQKACDDSRWSFSLAMNEIAREENSQLTPNKP